MISYFRPKPFESVRGKSVYRLVGVRFFKRYLLLTDLVMFRLRGKAQWDPSTGARATELRRLEWQTRRDETIHLVFLLGLAVFPYAIGREMNAARWTFLIAVNIYVNLYPIFVQRYNRFRLLRLMRAGGISTAYD